MPRANPSPVVRPSYTYEAVQEMALALEALLRDHGIAIQPGSLFERSNLSVLDIVYRKAGQSDTPITEDVRTQYRHLIGISELAGLIREVRNHADFIQLLPHLRLLNDGVALQNIPSSGSDQATDKLFELFAATLAMQCGHNVRLDDPVRSRGDNPDVLADFRGERWGIACKVLHSDHPETFIKHLEAGIAQIERSEAQTGLVMFNLKQLVQHNGYWPSAIKEFEFLDPFEPFTALRNEVNILGAKLRSYLPPGYLESVFVNKKTLPGFYLWAHTATSVLLDGLPTATSVRAGVFVRATPLTDFQTNVVNCLHWAAFVDSPSRPPCPLA